VPIEDGADEGATEAAPKRKARKRVPASTRSKRRAPVTPAFVLGTPPPPEELEYTEGAEIPPGYDIDTRARKGLVIAGAVTLGASWLLSSAAATLLIKKREVDEATSFGYRYDGDDDDETPPESALYIPLAGPWIALRTMNDDLSPEGRAALVADGVVQAAGLAMLIGGLAARQKVLVRSEEVSVGVAAGVGSAWMTGSF
jgi:hypothetical protein